MAAMLLVAASAGGCKRNAPHAAPSSDSANTIASPSIQQQVDQALGQLATVRGLEAKRPVPVRVVPAADYRAQLVQRLETLLTAGSSDLPSLWTALNFADPSVTTTAIVERAVDDSQVDAFYDADAGALVVREPKAQGYDARQDVAVIMALERALQDQHFGGGKSRIGLDVDANLALFTLREGDAAAASIAYFASRSGKPAVDAVDRTAVLLDSLPVDALITGVGYAPALASAPLLVRDELSRARPAGLQLVAAMLRAKGFELVNRALANPPTSMLTMYDPSLYVRGWQPMALPALAGNVRRGALGVVGVLAFVERCQPTTHAKSYVADWRGDAFSLDTRAKDGPIIVWRTAWKDEAAARRFSDEVTGAAQCRAPGTSAAVHFERVRKPFWRAGVT